MPPHVDPPRPYSPSRLWIFSDLHQEWPENAWDPAAHAPAGGFDVAIVAGDVHMPLTQALDWLGERMPGSAVAYVPGCRAIDRRQFVLPLQPTSERR